MDVGNYAENWTVHCSATLAEGEEPTDGRFVQGCTSTAISVWSSRYLWMAGWI